MTNTHVCANMKMLTVFWDNVVLPWTCIVTDDIEVC